MDDLLYLIFTAIHDKTSLH